MSEINVKSLFTTVKLTDGEVGVQLPGLSERHFKLDIAIAEFCLIMTYHQTGRAPARTRIADFAKFAAACAAIGAAHLPLLVTDDAELVFLRSLTPRTFLRRETETMVRKLYQKTESAGCDDPPADPADGCDDPPADAPLAAAPVVAVPAQYHLLMGIGPDALSAARIEEMTKLIGKYQTGELLTQLPERVPLMSDGELEREYPYPVVGAPGRFDPAAYPSYKSASCAIAAARRSSRCSARSARRYPPACSGRCWANWSNCASGSTRRASRFEGPPAGRPEALPSVCSRPSRATPRTSRCR